MGNYMFTEDGFKDYVYWQTTNRKIAHRILPGTL
ncbi:MAG: type II toxin-antitoxin system YoeB family toxin [Lachnospiraceae bacterium]|nr:type II toxin-antitoxin system YoeB family toxin [Lachnospiraceae bacterium]